MRRNHLEWKTEEGPRLGDRDSGPRCRNPDPGGRDLEDEAGPGWRCMTFDSDDLEVVNQFKPDFSLRYLRLSGSTNRVEECMGQDPGILRGRILARQRTRGMNRFSKTRRPKLWILMLDSTGLACASRVCKGSVASCLVSGSYLDFWQRGHSA
ncbi:hypothetical protein F2Q70_00037259 [Brassica cretica]|uniref:Uncharacterized protein n=1 Tax=Brassica cretica TaxID=69181 RepID=A0A8S9JQV9_BRACR|nr:hypothetical protein F2Q70_00037259 [Brassica cretica]